MDDVARRDRADAILRLIGVRVTPLLKAHAVSDDAEIKSRARAVIERIYVEAWR